MNIMKKAHIIARTIRNLVGSYREALGIALREAHRAAKAQVLKNNTKTEEGQKAIREFGAQTFRNKSSQNPFKEGTHAFDLFLDGWLQAKRDHYMNQGV